MCLNHAALLAGDGTSLEVRGHPELALPSPPRLGHLLQGALGCGFGGGGGGVSVGIGVHACVHVFL